MPLSVWQGQKIEPTLKGIATICIAFPFLLRHCSINTASPTTTIRSYQLTEQTNRRQEK